MGDVLVPAEVRFIEYMDVGGATGWDPALVVSRHEMLETLTRHFGKIDALSGQGAAPASRFALADGWTFGIVSSTTQPFCVSCDRSRLTADGVWYRCLYAHSGTDLRTPLRGGASDEELRQILVSAWRAPARPRRGGPADSEYAHSGSRHASAPRPAP